MQEQHRTTPQMRESDAVMRDFLAQSERDQLRSQVAAKLHSDAANLLSGTRFNVPSQLLLSQLISGYGLEEVAAALRLAALRAERTPDDPDPDFAIKYTRGILRRRKRSQGK